MARARKRGSGVFVRGQECVSMLVVVVMMTGWVVMSVGLRWRGELAGKDDPAAFALFGELFGYLWVMRANVANQTGQEAC